MNIVKNFMKLFFSILIFILFLFSPFTSIVHAAEYFVSTNGSDTNNGISLSSPFRTIQNGLNKANNPGDIVTVMPGTYAGSITMSNSGTDNSNRIILRAYNTDQKPILLGNGGSGDSDWSSFININASYVTFDGFEVSHAPGRGIVTNRNNLTGITISNCNVHHSMSENILIASTNTIVENCEISQGTLRAAPSPYNPANSSHTSPWDGGIVISQLPNANTTIRNNRIHNNWGEGIIILRVSDASVLNNTIYDNYALDLYMDNAAYVTVRNNLIYYTNDT
jgi:parallel beta-helix repeat protein